MVTKKANTTLQITFKSEKDVLNLQIQFAEHIVNIIFTYSMILEWSFSYKNFKFKTLIENSERNDPEGVLVEFLVGMCRPVLQILTLAISDHVISHTRFQTWPLDRNYVIIT